MCTAVLQMKLHDPFSEESSSQDFNIYYDVGRKDSLHDMGVVVK